MHMKSAQPGFFRWYIKSLKNQYKDAITLHHLKSQNPSVTIEDDVMIISPQNLALGKNIIIQKGTILNCGGMRWCDYRGKITIGDNCEIGPYCILYGAGEIEIGRGCGIAMGSTILSQQGDLSKVFAEGRDVSSSRVPIKYDKVIIGEGAWIAAHAVIMPGVTVGKGAVIAPGALVHKDVPPFKMALAPPARISQSAPRERDTDSDPVPT
jgi:acetyltransferase-like isoleucine patch superfamily enzyme